jgi:hypothetical protein
MVSPVPRKGYGLLVVEPSALEYQVEPESEILTEVSQGIVDGIVSDVRRVAKRGGTSEHKWLQDGYVVTVKITRGRKVTPPK